MRFPPFCRVKMSELAPSRFAPELQLKTEAASDFVFDWRFTFTAIKIYGSTPARTAGLVVTLLPTLSIALPSTSSPTVNTIDSTTTANTIDRSITATTNTIDGTTINIILGSTAAANNIGSTAAVNIGSTTPSTV